MQSRLASGKQLLSGQNSNKRTYQAFTIVDKQTKKHTRKSNSPQTQQPEQNPAYLSGDYSNLPAVIFNTECLKNKKDFQRKQQPEAANTQSSFKKSK